MNVLSVVGARPQFVKLAMLSRAVRKNNAEIIVHTGQHYDEKMSGTFFNDLNIPVPDYNLAIGSGSHGRQTGEMLIALEEVYLTEQPDVIVTFGDTNTTLASAVAAGKMCIPIAHVEAGLRSYNRSMPEEINRVLTDHCSDILFAPTQTAMDNLDKEGLSDKAWLTGDIMYDALVYYSELAASKSGILNRLAITAGGYLLVTLHRPYNVDDTERLRSILDALGRSGAEVVFPVHPRTAERIRQAGIEPADNIKITAPTGYLDFLRLEKNAAKIITDSGGIQKEAYLQKVPCITVRPETEWLETVEAGWNVLTGFDSEQLVDRIMHFNPPEEHPAVFGSADSAEKMARILEEKFAGTNK
jgi:UDP-GlcNAc3NAcA epimerase